MPSATLQAVLVRNARREVREEALRSVREIGLAEDATQDGKGEKPMEMLRQARHLLAWDDWTFHYRRRYRRRRN